MSIDIVDLRAFYASPLGRLAMRSLLGVIERMALESRKEPVIGLGYPIPLFDLDKDFSTDTLFTQNAIALMPATQGALIWPDAKNTRTALVEEDALPLANSSVQTVIMLHLIEHSADPLAALNEVWRILETEGRAIIIVANRRGFWARFEHTPFGTGRPFSRQQLSQILREAKLTPLEWREALNFLPIRNKRFLPFDRQLDRIGAKLWPLFCGAYVVHAVKRLYQGVPASQAKKHKPLIPVLTPQNSRVSRNNSS